MTNTTKPVRGQAGERREGGRRGGEVRQRRKGKTKFRRKRRKVGGNEK